MQKYLIIYHHEDNDGVVSGALFADYLMRKLNVERSSISLFGADYNSLTEFEKKYPIDKLREEYANIIMTDISFNDSKYMKKIYKEFGTNFIWCDHHNPIIYESFKEHFSSIAGVRSTTKSAILCAYEYLYDAFNEQYDRKSIPEIFRVLSAWDSWSYEREGYDFDYVKNVNKGCTISWKLDFYTVLSKVNHIMTHWDNEHKDVTKSILLSLEKYGQQLNEYDDFVMEGIVQQNGDKTWEVVVADEDNPEHPLHIKACAIFHQGATNSTMFKSLQKTNPDIQLGIVFKHAANGNWTLSMYNINNDYWFHCGEFLKKKYKGGGHKGAAGCTLTESQFIKILKSKTL